ncbi:uncharacterized protein [Rutidosis leptorrhynchoides]|uniref:uncharacterized protein n=1 Tax=Rutidosis leptorrhynchoides TaxID=125765 RepID=UPI003A9A316E
MTSYFKYLQDGTLPADATKARRIKVNALLYVLENGVLYRKSFNGPNVRYGLPNEIANGQVEVTNKEIVVGIKARLGLSQTRWVDEVPYVLWAHRTTPKQSMRGIPFNLVYTKAVILAKIRVPTHRVLEFDFESNSSILRVILNLLEERRIRATIRQADNKQRMAKYYNKRVKHVQIEEGDLVLRDNEASRQAKQGKLGPR